MANLGRPSFNENFMKYLPLGQIIKDKREGLGLKLEALAEDCGLGGASYLSRIENGKTPISPKVLKKLVAVLDLDLESVRKAQIKIAEQEITEDLCD